MLLRSGKRYSPTAASTNSTDAPPPPPKRVEGALQPDQLCAMDRLLARVHRIIGQPAIPTLQLVEKQKLTGT